MDEKAIYVEYGCVSNPHERYDQLCSAIIQAILFFKTEMDEIEKKSLFDFERFEANIPIGPDFPVAAELDGSAERAKAIIRIRCENRGETGKK